MAKLAVIVPVYNVEPYIKDCINSLIQQTMHDIDIICVDDCGTDKSMKIVEQFAQQDKRIKIVHNDKNSGLSESRNNGVRACNAEYIMFCDSDDFFAPDMCEKMYNAITADGADLAICGTEVIYEADHDQKQSDDAYFAVRHNGTMEKDMDIMRWYAVCAWNKIYKREIMTKYDVWFPRGLKYEDEFFYPAYLTYTHKIAFVPEKLYKYRRRAGSIMNTTFSQKHKLNTDSLKIAIAYWDWTATHDSIGDNVDWYWIHMFVKMFEGALNKNTPDNWDTLYDMANDFIKKHYNPMDVSFHTMCAMNNIIKRHPPKKMYIGGLIRVHTAPLKREWCICKTPVWKIKRLQTKNKYYLFGIRVAHKKIKPKFPKPRKTIELPIDNSQLLQELRKIGRFTYIPNPGNAGDMLIASATMGFFDKHKIPYDTYTPNANLDAVVYGGGGIWTADYKKDWMNHLDLFRNARKIIILPSSFNNCPELIDALDERFVVFCREKRSYEYLMAANTRATILLDHDMAFRMTKQMLLPKHTLSPKMIKTLLNISWENIPKRARFMRVDRESAGKYNSDLDVSDLAGGYFTDNRQWIDFCATLMLAVVNCADVVVTDRLHVAIAGLLTKKKVYMLDNTYGKLSAVYEHSMKQFENVHFCTTMPEL